jgi:hypothetical protein
MRERFGEPVAGLVRSVQLDAHLQGGNAPGGPPPARSRPSGCGACCWRWSMMCARCSSSWPTACSACASWRRHPDDLARAYRPGDPGGVCAAGPSPGHRRSSSGRWRICPSASWSPMSTAGWRSCWRKAAPSGRPSSGTSSERLEDGPARTRAGRGQGAGAAQTHLQHLAQDARKQLDFEELYDLRAVRVIVDRVSTCYTVLGVVHGLWPHIPQEFDDYIANPKDNGYQSLHTAVIGPEGQGGGGADPHPGDG